MWLINEGGLYEVVIRSDKPEAKAFRRWITHEVLPAIRKTGGYGLEVERMKIQRERINISKATALHKMAKESAIDEEDRRDLMEKAIALLI